MTISNYTQTGGFRSRGGFYPSTGLPADEDILTPVKDRAIRRGDSFTAKEAGSITGVTRMPVGGFAPGDRIVFRGTDITRASDWLWVGPSVTIPPNPHDATKKAPIVVASETDNSQ